MPLRPINQYALQSPKDPPPPVVFQVAKNSMILQMLMVIFHLIEAGFYEVDDIVRIRVSNFLIDLVTCSLPPKGCPDFFAHPR